MQYVHERPCSRQVGSITRMVRVFYATGRKLVILSIHIHKEITPYATRGMSFFTRLKKTITLHFLQEACCLKSSDLTHRAPRMLCWLA